MNKCQQSAIKHCYLGPQDTHPHPIRRSISNRRFLSARQRHRSFSFQANSRDLLLRATRARGPTPRSAIDFWWEHNADLFTGQSETFFEKVPKCKVAYFKGHQADPSVQWSHLHILAKHRLLNIHRAVTSAGHPCDVASVSCPKNPAEILNSCDRVAWKKFRRATAEPKWRVPITRAAAFVQIRPFPWRSTFWLAVAVETVQSSFISRRPLACPRRPRKIRRPGTSEQLQKNPIDNFVRHRHNKHMVSVINCSPPKRMALIESKIHSNYFRFTWIWVIETLNGINISKINSNPIKIICRGSVTSKKRLKNAIKRNVNRTRLSQKKNKSKRRRRAQGEDGGAGMSKFQDFSFRPGTHEMVGKKGKVQGGWVAQREGYSWHAPWRKMQQPPLPEHVVHDRLPIDEQASDLSGHPPCHPLARPPTSTSPAELTTSNLNFLLSFKHFNLRRSEEELLSDQVNEWTLKVLQSSSQIQFKFRLFLDLLNYPKCVHYHRNCRPPTIQVSSTFQRKKWLVVTVSLDGQTGTATLTQLCRWAT